MNTKHSIGIIICIAAIGGVVLLLRVRPPQMDQSGKLNVVAGFYPLAFFAGEIGGEYAEVTNITPAGAEPHDYEPTAQDIARIEQSRLLILNGGGLEAWGSKMRENIDNDNTHIVAAAEGLTAQDAEEKGKVITDPHVWLSPALAQEMADAILRGFITADPLHRDAYETNAAVLKARLTALDRAYREGLARCTKKDIITSHAAFGYLADAYHLHQVSVASLSPDDEPSPAALGEIAQFAKKNNVKYIFFERLMSPKLSETIAREIGARTLVLNPIEGLTSDEIAQGKNYFTQMQDNLTNLKLALQCAP